MTLILTVVAGQYVVQASDRLTTRDGDEHDPRANKSVVFRSRDGVFAIGYSGLAYIDNLPTDEWLASAVVGQPLGTCGFGCADWSHVTDIGLALKNVAAALSQAYTRLPARHRAYFYAIAAGWQGSRRGKRALAYELTNRGPDGRGVFLWAPATPRPTMPSGKFALLQSPYVLTPAESDLLRARLRDADPDDPRDAEEALASSVQGVALRSETVGPHTMVITLSPRIQPFVKCRFVPGPAAEVATPGVGGFSGKPQSVTPSGAPTIPEGAPAGYTPLILAPRFLHLPSVMVGGFVASTGDLEISFEGPASDVPRVFLGTHRREPPP